MIITIYKLFYTDSTLFSQISCYFTISSRAALVSSTMSDSEERPTKFRKLSQTDNFQDSKHDLSTITHSQNDSISSRPATESESRPEESPSSHLANGEQVHMSKNQLKRIRKQQEWEAGKEDRKAKRREKTKEKKARKADLRKNILEKVANGELDPSEALTKKEIRHGPARPIPVPVSLIMDCDFNELMTEKELISLGAQLTRCYSDNRTNPYRTHYVISSWGGKLKTRFETVLTNNQLGWKGVVFTDKDFVGAATDIDEVMRGPSGGRLAGAIAGKGEGTAEIKPVTPSHGTTPKPKDSIPSTAGPEPIGDIDGKSAETLPIEGVSLTITPSEDEPRLESETADAAPPSKSNPSIVYLSSDSPHTLDRLQPYTSYIVGGIVDKNRHKGLCYKRACERGIRTAKLPIGKYMTMQSRSVLAINHVVEIMLKWLETGDWAESFLSVIPKRKEAKLRVQKKVGNGEQEEQGDDGGQEEEESEEEDEGGVKIYSETPSEPDLA